MKYFSLLAGIMCLIISCKNAPEEKKEQHEENMNFPISDFIKGQIKLVDSTGLGLKKIITENSRSDTSYIDIKEFDSLAKEFTLIDISSPGVKGLYKEASFADQSAPNITFNYTATEPSLEIQRVDLILKPNPVGDETVMSVYAEKQSAENGTTVIKKMYWRTNKSFQVITGNGDASTIKILKVEWEN